MSTASTPRNLTIDVARGLGMLAIVWGHNAYVHNPPGEVFRVLFSFHVPLFFCLTGAMLPTGTPVHTLLARRSRALLQPYAVVLGMLLLVGAAKQWRTGGDWLAHALGSLHGMAWGTGSTLPWPPLWFLPHLLLASASTLMWLNTCNRLQPGSATLPLLSTLPLLAGGWAVLDHMTPKGLPWSLDLLPLSMACMLLGHAVRTRMANPKLSLSVLLGLAAAFATLHGVWDETIDLNLRHYGQPLVATAQALLGMACVMGLAERLARVAPVAKPLAYLGEHSLAVLLFHVWIQDMTTAAVWKATQHSTLTAAVSFAVACTTPLLIWALAARWTISRRLLMPSASTTAGR
jgi:fucose 4-O-acetylase-like acetyltransferase